MTIVFSCMLSKGTISDSLITQPFYNLFHHSADRDTDISTAGCQVYRLSCLGKVNVKEAIS